MTDLTVLAHFTKNGNDDPATGLTLAEIDLYLTAINRTSGAQTVIWDGTQNPAFEVSNVGAYGKIYTLANFDTFNYSGGAQYTGSETVDNAWVSGTIGEGVTFAGDEGTEDKFFMSILVVHKNNPTGLELVTVQEDIFCAPIDRLSQDWQQSYPIEKLFLMRQTFTKYTAFQPGDYLLDNNDLLYAVKVVHDYDAQGGLDAFTFLILEEQSGS
jgi:hypothetical protein